jgi:hypothetical protein
VKGIYCTKYGRVILKRFEIACDSRSGQELSSTDVLQPSEFRHNFLRGWLGGFAWCCLWLELRIPGRAVDG